LLNKALLTRVKSGGITAPSMGRAGEVAHLSGIASHDADVLRGSGKARAPGSDNGRSNTFFVVETHATYQK
ncbi:hypothetical protein, partial [Paraburkholderia sp. NMBU_R16]|uniref:hypothetical protein n=1 Tax=Paraburkholderia sp. NMBU_R16 TaxID=2698676 RepID=UPI001C27BDA8